MSITVTVVHQKTMYKRGQLQFVTEVIKQRLPDKWFLTKYNGNIKWFLGDARLTAGTCCWELKPVNTERLPAIALHNDFCIKVYNVYGNSEPKLDFLFKLSHTLKPIVCRPSNYFFASFLKPNYLQSPFSHSKVPTWHCIPK